MSSRVRRFRASLLYLLQTNIIIIFLLSAGESPAFFVSADPVTGRAQIVSIPTTSNLADRINYIDDVNTNTYPDSCKASAYGGSTIPVTSGADINIHLQTPIILAYFTAQSQITTNHSKVHRHLNHSKVRR
jgi:hypothetical protein